MSNEIVRATGLLVIEAVASNPNDDPDRESDPRQRPNGIGEISPASYKRKLRDLVEDQDGPVFQELQARLGLDPEAFCILESRGRERKVPSSEMAKDSTSFDQAESRQSTCMKKYWDARLFGNTFQEEGVNKGYIKSGVAQFAMGLSLTPVQIERHTSTNEAGVEEGMNQGMAPLAYRVVEHGVYCMPFYIDASNAHKSGCTQRDIELLKALIPYAYDHTRSAIRPDVRIRHAWYMEHKNKYGSCPDHLLIDALTPHRKGEDPLAPSVSWADYDDESARLSDALLEQLASCVDLVDGI